MFHLTAGNFALTSSQSQADLAEGAALSDPTCLGSRFGGSNAYLLPTSRDKPIRPIHPFPPGYTITMSGRRRSEPERNVERNRSLSERHYGHPYRRDRKPRDRQRPPSASPTTPTRRSRQATTGAETFAFSAGYGKETIDGFAPSGTNADTLVLSTSDFSYLTGAMTQAQDLAAVLSHVSLGSNGVTIGDKWGDSAHSCRRQRRDSHRQPKRREIRLIESTLQARPGVAHETRLFRQHPSGGAVVAFDIAAVRG